MVSYICGWHMNAHVRSSILRVTSRTSVPALAWPRDPEALWSRDLVVFFGLWCPLLRSLKVSV